MERLAGVRRSMMRFARRVRRAMLWIDLLWEAVDFLEERAESAMDGRGDLFSSL